MKADQYFKLEVNFMSDDRISDMMMEMDAAESLGIYIALLVHLRQHDNYAAGYTPRLLGAFARKYGFRMEKVEAVLRNYGLFVFDEQRRVFHSDYLDQVLEELEKVRAKCAEGGRKSTSKRSRKKPTEKVNEKEPQSPYGSGVQTIVQQKSKEKESKKNTSNENKAKEAGVKAGKTESEGGSMAIVDPREIGQRPLERMDRPWEELVDEVAASELYMEDISMHSKLGRLFIDHQQEVVRLFKEHVRLQGSGAKILTVCDARCYFTNFMRAGTQTCFRIRDALLTKCRKAENANPYRFETLVDGRRTYLGRPIPEGAPPRPDKAAVWNTRRHCWGY